MESRESIVNRHSGQESFLASKLHWHLETEPLMDHHTEYSPVVHGSGRQAVHLIESCDLGRSRLVMLCSQQLSCTGVSRLQ